MLNKLRGYTQLIVSRSNYLIQVVDTNSHTEWQTDLDLHCLQRQDISGFSRARVKLYLFLLRLHRQLCELIDVLSKARMLAFCGHA